MLWGVVAIAVVLVPVAMIFGSQSDNSDRELTAILVKETLEDREIPCDAAEVKNRGSFFDPVTEYECVVAGESFLFVIHNADSGNAEASIIDRFCSSNIPFTYLVGTNWRARTSSPLVDFGVLQDAFGGILATDDELCPIFLRTLYLEDDPRYRWDLIFTALQRESSAR